MKYIGIPLGMWVLFEKSFRKNLVSELGYNKLTAKQISKNAKSRYKSIIRNLPEFEKGDRFKTNIVGCAMLSAFVLSIMGWLCRQSGKKKFTAKDIAEMKKTAELKAADRNPYSWNMDFYEYSDGSGYEGRFTKCGICVLMKELGLFDLTPAMCRLDYTMSEAGGATNFVRRYTIASGGSYCDCGYKKKI